MMETAYLSETMATSAPSPHNYTVSQTRRPKFKYSPPLKPENSNTFNIISLYYVNSPFGFDSCYRKDFFPLAPYSGWSWDLLKILYTVYQVYKMPSHLHHSTKVKNACSYTSPMLHLTQATLLLYTIYIFLFHMNTATI